MKSSLILAVILTGLTTASTAQDPGAPRGPEGGARLSDRYFYVVKDVLKYCQPQKGFWIDVGAGKGQVTIPLIEETGNPVIMLDPDVEAMSKGLDVAREKGLEDRLAAVVGVAENMPFPDNSVDLLVSRGSIFFWDAARRESLHRGRCGQWVSEGGNREVDPESKGMDAGRRR
jgi:SAM-dependent methyltransferase